VGDPGGEAVMKGFSSDGGAGVGGGDEFIGRDVVEAGGSIGAGAREGSLMGALVAETSGAGIV